MQTTSYPLSGPRGSYSEAIQYLYDRLPVFHHVGSSAYKPGLNNTIQLMNALKNPHMRYRTIHVAGTNGKGSVSHLLASVLQCAGYKVGLYTSPHLVDFGERIRVNGTTIDEQYVVDFVEDNKALFDKINPSFFEATMAMAFNYFADSEVDIAVIEVGLGGRLDSTNIIHPGLSVITNISYDHTGFLGDSLENIAFEKAGIIKKNTPVVIGETLPETRPVFEGRASEENAPIYFAEELVEVSLIENQYAKTLVKTSNNKSYIVGLTGTYQLKNIATTLTAIEELRKQHLDISETCISKGLEFVTEITGLRGRWEVLQQNPTVVADTGHNAAGIQCVVGQLKTQKFDTLRIVIGMVNDKDISSVLAILPQEATYYFTQANIPRALAAKELKEMAQSYSLNGLAYSSVEEAVKSAISESKTGDFILIGGSNFVVGEALAMRENSAD
jgi:dihydrofolate synthase / folylpolyglutamate synthase